MEPDLNQLRLQQLLQPFNNQRGVMSTNSAIPMINSIPMINTGMIDQNLQNTDLVQQIIAQNQQRFNTADTAPFFFPQGGITTVAPQQTFQDYYSGVYEPYDPEKDDYQVRQIEGPEKKGIGKLMEILGNIPTPLNLLRKAFEGAGPGFIGPKGSRAYGDESLFSTFGRSRTGAEFFQNLRDRKARQEAAARGAIKQQELARQTALQQMRSDDAYGGGGADRPGGFGSGAGSFKESEPTATEGSF